MNESKRSLKEMSRKLWPVPIALVLVLLVVFVLWNPFSINIIGAGPADNGQGNLQDRVASANPVLNERWQSMVMPNIGSLWRLNAVAFAGPNDGWAVGSDINSTKGVVIRYSNGAWYADFMPYAGKNWTIHLSGIALSGSRDGWAVGDKYYIWSDPDRFRPLALRMSGGRWSVTGLPNVPAQSSELAAVAEVPGTNTAFAVGGGSTKDRQREGIIMRYDGHWSLVSPPSVRADWWELHDITFPSADRGWAVGKAVHPSDKENALLVLAYRNGQWVQESVPPAYGLTHGLLAVDFPTPEIGWAGGEGALLKYSAGKWEKDTVPGNIENYTIKSISFMNKDVGWAIGVDNSKKKPLWLQHTSKGWQVVATKWDEYIEELNAVFFLKSGLGFAVGGMSYRGNYPGAVLTYTETSTP